ncbi:MAG: type II secretion system protein GspD, partial [Gammaproteobacteria bacterium]
TPAEQQPATASELTLPSGSTVRIIADVVNNALVVFSSAADYQMIEAALKKLDIVPLQVLIEATIYEVTLADNLRFGVEWFFRNTSGGGGRATGISEFTDIAIPLSPTLGTAASSGFSYLISSAGQVRAALNMLASESKANILSAPALMVLDNQTATINVSDEVPVPTSQRVSTTEVNAPQINEIDFRDAGVILEVTPRVNASGLVSMEISQEVSEAIANPNPALLGGAPTFSKRQVESTVAVQSGNTIVLGGLIEDTRRDTDSGIPGLYKIPVLGKLFGDFRNSSERRELVVLITPRAVRNEEESLRVTEEFKRKLEQLAPPRAVR